MSNSGNEAGLPIETTMRQQQPEVRPAPPKRLPPYNVVLLNDHDHTYDYVIEMLGSLFGYNPTKGFLMADQLNPRGRVIVLTTHKEHAELKRDQIHAYGKDNLEGSKGSMWSTIEAVE